jgi:hypothetical protein
MSSGDPACQRAPYIRSNRISGSMPRRCMDASKPRLNAACARGLTPFGSAVPFREQKPKSWLPPSERHYESHLRVNRNGSFGRQPLQ